MAVELVTREDVNSRCAQALGLDSQSLDLSAPEAVAAALRRAASFLCPTTAGRLIGAVEEAFAPVVDATSAELKVLTGDVLEALVGYGDLLELEVVLDESAVARTQLYLAPPSFVRRASGLFLLFGVRPEASPLVGEELLPLIESERHVRKLRSDAPMDARALLLEYGLRELPDSTWLKSPKEAQATEVRLRFDSLLARAGPSGDIQGVTVLDPGSSVRFYNGRWRSPSSRDNGNFVARRPQAYGAHVWCYGEFQRGVVVRAIDLPIPESGLTRGCDAAWYLQAAIDAAAGHPQVLKIRKSCALKRATFELFSPPPSWLQRRWDTLGTPVKARGALVAYVMEEREIAEEKEFASRMLWLDVLEEAE